MGIYIPWLVDAARMTGYPVVEVPGWRDRGHGPMRAVEGVVFHHTANPQSGVYPSLRIVRDGRADLAGPLAHLGLGRDGTVFVIAAGQCWHAGASAWAGMYDLNDEFVGIEGESAGTSDDWTPEQRDCYPRLMAALLHFMRRGAERAARHAEVCRPAGRKIDAAYWDGPETRERIAWLLADPTGRIPRGAQPTSERTDEMVSSYPIEGRGVLMLIVPVGSASGVTAAGWVSASVAEKGTLRCYAQSDTTGVHDWSWDLTSKDGHCPRPYMALRDGVTQVKVHYDLTGTGVVGIETRPK